MGGKLRCAMGDGGLVISFVVIRIRSDKVIEVENVRAMA
jgi:hypothetical protein